MTISEKLTAALPKLTEGDRNFAQSLIQSALGRWGLSQKQEMWAHKLIARAEAVSAPTANVSVEGIISLLAGAINTGKLKRPKIRMVTASGKRVVLAIAGKNSRYCGDVMVTDGGPFGNNVYFGRIAAATGDIMGRDNMDAEVLSLLVEFASDPAGVGSRIGKLTGNCCFCSRALETKESLAVGYGPTCASHYGLPWG